MTLKPLSKGVSYTFHGSLWFANICSNSQFDETPDNVHSLRLSRQKNFRWVFYFQCVCHSDRKIINLVYNLSTFCQFSVKLISNFGHRTMHNYVVEKIGAEESVFIVIIPFVFFTLHKVLLHTSYN